MNRIQHALIKPYILDSLTEAVGTIWRDLQTQYTASGNFFVASPLSRTPLPIYRWLIEHASTIPHWETCKFVFMDEQVRETNGTFQYLPIDNPASFEGFAKKNFLEALSKQAAIDLNQMILKPDLENLPAFDTALDAHGGLDLLILAIGEGGHYALVMPETPIEQGYHLVDIAQQVVTQHVEKNGPYQGTDFRNKGMSLGPKQVLGAKHVVVIISGENKRELTKQLFSYNTFDPQFPLSIIFHPKVKDRVQIFLTPDVLGDMK